jgi:RNA polymerase primary sigma factor
MRPPTLQEIEEELDDPNIINDLQHMHFMISLDEPRTDNNETLHSVIFEPEHDLEIILDNFQTDIKELIRTFPKREQDILLMYYGIGHVRDYTLHEIGVDLGLTRERIRQIKEYVIRKLKEKRDTKILKQYRSNLQ